MYMSPFGNNGSLLTTTAGENKFFSGLTRKEQERFLLLQKYNNFYEGYHWEGIAKPTDDNAQLVTENFCKIFVDKYVAFELGKAFYMRFSPYLEAGGEDGNPVDVIPEEFASKDKNGNSRRSLGDYMAQVWYNNDIEVFCTEFGHMKSVSGEVWTGIFYEAPGEFADPYEEFPNGKIRLTVMPTELCFATYDSDDTDRLVEFEIRYLREKSASDPNHLDYDLIRKVWKEYEVIDFVDDQEVGRYRHDYGLIPFVRTKNLSVAGNSHGLSDLESIIPMNVTNNKAMSDLAEILNYHAAPITLLYGMKVGNLEGGSNKIWGNIPKDGKVENLEMRGDLSASLGYVDKIKKSLFMHASTPETVLGGASGVSNTSGVALQYVNLPLIEKTQVKKLASQSGLEDINKIIIYLSEKFGLIERPAGVSSYDFFYNVVTIPDTLPKDQLLELQRIGEEMKLGLTSREEAMARLGKEDINASEEKINEDFAEYPMFYAPSYAITLLQQQMVANKQTKGGAGSSGAEISEMGKGSSINSGMSNSQSGAEQARIETTGRNA